jgi:hypothetical protein
VRVEDEAPEPEEGAGRTLSGIVWPGTRPVEKASRAGCLPLPSSALERNINARLASRRRATSKRGIGIVGGDQVRQNY